MAHVTFEDIVQAKRRITPFINETPILQSSLLNHWLGHEIYFKAECFQRTGAFKLRGACNVLAKLAEMDELPKKIVANSSGNHAQAIAYAASIFEVPATIYTVDHVSKVKAAATQLYGAELLTFPTRTEADNAVAQAAQEEGTLWIPPFNHPDIIAGQGTAAYEALYELNDIDLVCAPCGGGGLAAGTLLSTRTLCPAAEVIGAEPLNANDAAESLRSGKIESLSDTPNTLADGAATPAVGEYTFPHLQALDGFYEVEETRIAYWTQWLQHLLKAHIEPTCAMSMEAVCQWLKNQDSPKRVLVMLSGGNIDEAKMRQIWEQDHLQILPALNRAC